MNRRNFLKSVALTAGVASWPLWLKSAFAKEPLGAECGANDGPSRGVKAVAEAYRRAYRAGKPLFVIVIPASDSEKWERGTHWGELLNHGSDEQLAPLALAEVACATLAELRQIVPTAIAGEPMIIVADTSGTPAKTRGASVVFERVPERWSAAGNMTWEELRKVEDEAVNGNIERLAAGVRAALLPDGAIEGHAAQARAMIGADEARAIERALASNEELDVDAVDRAAAIVMLEALRNESAKLHHALALAVKKRLCVQPPLGAHWAISGGCGVDIEGEDNELMMACGMGHSPEKSRRFLYLFAQTPGERFKESLERRERGDVDPESE